MRRRLGCSVENLRRRAGLVVVAWAVLGFFASGARADEASHVQPTRTAKERLGGKASDEQRVDNCKVPPDLRGRKPRPERCGDGTGEKR